MARQVGYPSDMTDAEQAFVAPSLALVREDAPQRQHSLRAVFNAVRYLGKTGCGWRYLSQELPPWEAVYQQGARWRDNHLLEHLLADLRSNPRAGRAHSGALGPHLGLAYGAEHA
jgi:transposase